MNHLEQDGTRIRLRQGNYALNDDGRRIREGHIEGWIHFLGKLQEKT